MFKSVTGKGQKAEEKAGQENARAGAKDKARARPFLEGIASPLAAMCSEQLQEEPCWDSDDVPLLASCSWRDMSLSKRMYACIFKLTCMCVCARAHVCIVSLLFVCWALCVRARVYIHIYVCVCVCMCVCVCVCSCLCLCLCSFVCLFICLCVYVNIRKGLPSPRTPCVKFTAGGLGLDSHVCLLYMESE